MNRIVWIALVVVTLSLTASAAMAGPYWGAKYTSGVNVGRGVVCRDINNNNYYAMFLVPTPGGGLTTTQRAAIIAGRLNALYNPNDPYRSTQFMVGTQNGEYIVYIANRRNTSGQMNNWLILTVDAAWARSINTNPYGAALYWRDRMRYLAANWTVNSRGQWEHILTSSGQGEGHKLTADEKALANSKNCSSIPKGYEKRADKDPALEGTVEPLPTTVPANEKVRDLK
ncbi:MAG: hypothetical protein WCP21_12615 [Armatimonadota bacterium]